ncbi:extracellular solute-binding protein, partial [Paenibacillus sepulcri]|nr:extracellular solute-binding protein [Paenibacillus sepulcri]
MKIALKWSSVSIVLLALAIFSAACGGGNNAGNGADPSAQPDNEAAGTTEESTAPAADAAPVEITVWDKPHADDADKTLKEQQFADFETKYPSIKVTHVEQTKGKEREQFMTAVAGGQQPDAYLNAYPDMAPYIAQGITADITDMWNAFPEKDKYLPSSLDAATKDGKIYGVPSTMYVTALMYNKKMFVDAGIDPAAALKDWTSFAEAA